MLAYTMEKLLTETCVVERDVAILDAFGGEAKADRQIVGIFPCRYAWWHMGAARGGSREYATPQRTINFTGGGLYLEPGTDVQDQDHIKEILSADGTVFAPGPFRVVGRAEWDDHVEVNLMRP